MMSLYICEEYLICLEKAVRLLWFCPELTLGSHLFEDYIELHAEKHKKVYMKKLYRPDGG